MSLLDAILNTQDGAVVQQVGNQFGLDQGQAAAALSALVPALAGRVQQNSQTPAGLESLLGALTNGDHQKYVNDPSTLGAQTTIDDGNGILGHLLGSKEASREVAGQASAATGIGSDVMKKLLPIAASLV